MRYLDKLLAVLAVALIGGTPGGAAEPQFETIRHAAEPQFETIQGAAEPQFETILLPFYIYGPASIPGAFGSEWKLDLWVRNDNDSTVFVGPCAPGFPEPGQGTACVPDVHGRLDPNATHVSPYVDLGYLGTGRNGKLIYLRSDQRPENLHFGLRIVNGSDSFSSGTAIPIIRSSDFRTGTTHLLNIPRHSGLRSLLRIYDVDDHGTSSRVNVRIYQKASPFSAEVLMFSGEFTFQLAGAGRVADMPVAPSTIVLPLESVVPPETIGPLRVELHAASSGLRYWAFVTATDNVTQHVTIISPD